MIQTMLSSPEHLSSAKQAGIYGHLLHYVNSITSGSQATLPTVGDAKDTRQASAASSSQVLTTTQPKGQNVQASQKGNEKAMNYFTACLRIMGLEDEVALTEDLLKSAYKKAVIRAHPDKGGSEKEFEAVTRAYGYLGEILKRIYGGRSKEGKVEAPAMLQSGRTTDSEAWKMVEPVRVNPDKLDMKVFNELFEKTRIPDPEENGYGDWLKGDTIQSSTPKFSGKFNREVFHKAFEEDQASKRNGDNSQMIQQPKELSLASRIGYGVELGRTGRDDYTMASNEGGLQYTDLKRAYTSENTFSHQVNGVRVEERNLEQYTKARGKAPNPLTEKELYELQESEKAMARMEEQRKLRMAQEAVHEQSYFDRMKQLVLRN